MTPRGDSKTDPAGLIFLGAVVILVGLAFNVAFGILYLQSGHSLLRIDSDAQLTVTAGSLMQLVGVVAIIVAVRQERRRRLNGRDGDARTSAATAEDSSGE